MVISKSIKKKQENGKELYSNTVKGLGIPVKNLELTNLRN